MRTSVRIVALVLVVLASLPVTARAEEPPSPNGADVVAGCEAGPGQVPEAGGRACRGVESTGWNLADLCRTHLPATPEDCGRFDGRVVSEAEVAAYESSWVHRALGLQRALDDRVGLLRSQWAHTHNTFNAFAYDLTLTGLDSNHVYSIRDQLRMDMRAIEFDIHWVPSVHGSPATGGKAVTLCHGRTESTPAGPVHVGCSNDPPFADGLRELRGWLDEPGNGDEVVMLYLQNELDDDPVAHDAAVAAIEAELGSLVYRQPAAEPCAPLPLDLSKAAIRAAGARVLLVGNCGPGAWGSMVFERGPRWDEASSPFGDDYAAAGCEAERAAVGYDTHFVRRYEDSTAVSYWAGQGGELTAVETARMVACGVHWIGFDQLVPDDARLEALVWSWAPQEPSVKGKCAAARTGDGRFVSRGCDLHRRVVCATADGGWAVTAKKVGWRIGAEVCAAEFPGSRFEAPANGFEHAGMVAAKAAAGATETWVAYSRLAGDWTTPG